jgi:hypothetical protein
MRIVDWFTEERLSLMARLWVLASVFVVPFLILDLLLLTLILWGALGAILGAAWYVRHKDAGAAMAGGQKSERGAP